MKNKKAFLMMTVALLAPVTAHAQMPWEQPLTLILASISGPTAKILLTLAIVVSGLAFALGESGGLYRKMAGVVFGGSIALGAAALAGTLFAN